MLKVLDLFSGIGGFSLGLQRTGGFETVAFCEIEPFCQRVLAKHWPEVPCYDDVRNVTANRLRSDGLSVDVICGGFPCQDISLAGKGAGLAGSRSGLWSEIARLVSELRPRFVIVENVAALLGRGLGDVLGDLASVGYDAEWHCIPASAVGAHHRRDRVWIVAYPSRSGSEEREEYTRRIGIDFNGSDTGQVSNANISRLAEWDGLTGNYGSKLSPLIRSNRWAPEPDVDRVAYGIPYRVDRLKGLGNAVVPQIPELIGRAILEGLAA